MFENNAQAPLNPHFLFNSMNAIRFMIFENQDVASELLSKLADLVRYQLADGKIKTDVAKELIQVENLIALEQLRLEERLEVSLKFNTLFNKYSLDQSLILPLIEFIFIKKDIYSVEHNHLTIETKEQDAKCMVTLTLVQTPKIKSGELDLNAFLTKLNANNLCNVSQTVSDDTYHMELIINNDN